MEVVMISRPMLSAIAGSRDANAQKLDRMERLVKQAREFGNPPRTMTCIRASIVFHRKMAQRDDAWLTASDSMEQAAIDTLVARFIEDVAYVVENISPHEGSAILSYATELYFKRAMEEGSPSIGLYLGKECNVQVSACRAS